MTTDPPVVEIATCPLCGRRAADSLRRYQTQPLGLVRCRTCGLVRATGRFAREYLVEHYYGIRAQQVPSDERLRKRRALAAYDRLSPKPLLAPIPGAQALDVGCHTGVLLDELQRVGYRTTGIEQAPAAAELAAKRHTILPIDIEDPAATLPNRYDLITITHVLEHLEHPIQALRLAAAHLRRGGTLILEVPNWRDPARAVWGRHYRPLELGDHVAFYEMATLEQAIRRAKLQPTGIWSRPFGATAVMPSVLSALDLASATTRPDGGRPSNSRLRPRSVPSSLRRRALRALDRLDPWLDAIVPKWWDCGANLIALAQP